MRQWMIEMRKTLGLRRKAMARLCKCTERLLEILELEDGITHPNIASWIAFRYGMDVEQYNMLVSEKRRVKKIPEPKQPPKDEDFFITKYSRQKFN